VRPKASQAGLYSNVFTQLNCCSTVQVLDSETN